MTKTAFILAGHAVINGRGTGAFGVDGFDEAAEALRLRNDLSKRLLEMGVKVVNENSSFSLGQVITWLKSLIKRGDLVLEIHFNAGPSSATGIETLIDDTPTKEEIYWGKRISAAIQRVTKEKLRGSNGVKKESESQHKRLAIISDVESALNLLLEVGFITNENFIKSYRDGYKEMVEELAKEVRDYCLG